MRKQFKSSCTSQYEPNVVSADIILIPSWSLEFGPLESALCSFPIYRPTLIAMEYVLLQMNSNSCVLLRKFWWYHPRGQQRMSVFHTNQGDGIVRMQLWSDFLLVHIPFAHSWGFWIPSDRLDNAHLRKKSTKKETREWKEEGSMRSRWLVRRKEKEYRGWMNFTFVLEMRNLMAQIRHIVWRHSQLSWTTSFV